MSTVSRALRIYSEMRRPVAQLIQEASRRNGMFLVEPLPDHEIADEKEIQRTAEQFFHGDPFEDARKAREMLEDTLFD